MLETGDIPKDRAVEPRGVGNPPEGVRRPQSKPERGTSSPRAQTGGAADTDIHPPQTPVALHKNAGAYFQKDANDAIKDSSTVSKGSKGSKTSKPRSSIEASILGSSPELRRAITQAKRVGLMSCSILIQGETGTGKENLARLVHESSGLGGPFVPVNCATLTDELANDELFGHRRGAFTGALQLRIGAIEAADGGTLFLDEVGELSLKAQANLLRVLQQRAIRRIGENVEIPVNFRIVSATNRNLEMMVKEKSFRQDLYYRLAEATITLPSLHARGRDVITIARHFLNNDKDMKGKGYHLSHSASSVLCEHRWPGNVRELQNVLRAAYINGCGQRIKSWHIEKALGRPCKKESQPKPEIRILELIDRQNVATAAELRTIAMLSHTTCHRILVRMQRKGKIVRQDAGGVVQYARASRPEPSTACTQQPTEITPREQSVLELVAECGEVRRQDLVTNCGFAERTACRLLGQMEKKGLLEKHGIGRAQHYTLPPPARLASGGR